MASERHALLTVGRCRWIVRGFRSNVSESIRWLNRGPPAAIAAAAAAACTPDAVGHGARSRGH